MGTKKSTTGECYSNTGHACKNTNKRFNDIYVIDLQLLLSLGTEAMTITGTEETMAGECHSNTEHVCEDTNER